MRFNGRSGKFFAHQYAGIKPDLISVAKGIANGFPMGGLLISPKFKPVYGMLGTTFGGNHLACAAAIAVLDIMEDERLIDNAAKVGAYLLEELHKLPGIKEIRGRGLMIGIEFEESIKEVRSKLLFEEKVFTGVAGTNTIRSGSCSRTAVRTSFWSLFQPVASGVPSCGSFSSSKATHFGL